ncbi:hypothetical protein PR202_gb22224 [Eleusine coracana subsp. coracana]|uniref:Uncharacterized protein n=1 Tax=Eleusine coracana subsp. coracana TaxID=191504 RepID=A0AAV5FFN1_ELECO|nr:hypothetical protein QOZ80_6AG0539700 [Eleusine coracana subsp. coracana]GJN33604.1 hypothetical protein PR202_gb22224 [Eleusine coracana subsp. coracana]
MGRPRGGKAKRPTSQATKTEDADAGSGDDEAAVVPALKRRGRPERHYFKADTDEEGDDDVKVEAMEESDGAKSSVPSNNGASVENGGRKRRRRPSKRVSDSAMEEKDDEPAVRQVGFRHHGSRRKSTPRRAAEAGVECN